MGQILILLCLRSGAESIGPPAAAQSAITRDQLLQQIEKNRRQEEERKDQETKERRQKEAREWRSYGSIKVKWDEWKLSGDAIRTTRIEVPFFWYRKLDSIKPTVKDDFVVCVRSLPCPATKSKAVFQKPAHDYIKVDCSSLQVSIELFDGTTEQWHLPAKGTETESIVVDLCANTVR